MHIVEVVDVNIIVVRFCVVYIHINILSYTIVKLDADSTVVMRSMILMFFCILRQSSERYNKCWSLS